MATRFVSDHPLRVAPALLGWPILDLWRNPDRQLPHDRTVHTVVLRRQRQARKPTTTSRPTPDASLPSPGEPPRESPPPAEPEP